MRPSLSLSLSLNETCGLADWNSNDRTVASATAARNATATMCKEPVRDKSRQAVLAASITGIIALAFICVRMHEAYVRKEFHWADLCAVLAMVSKYASRLPLFGTNRR